MTIISEKTINNQLVLNFFGNGFKTATPFGSRFVTTANY